MPDPLIAVARQVLEDRGFHGATLTEVAERSGVPLDEVTARFGDEAHMFLAVVDDFLTGQIDKYDKPVDAETWDDAITQYAQHVRHARLSDGMPSWDRVLVEFWIHATRDPEASAEVRRRNTANLDRVAGGLDALAARYGRRWLLPTREVARGVFSLGRGMGLEWTMDDTWDPAEVDVMMRAYLLGVSAPREARA